MADNYVAQTAPRADATPEGFIATLTGDSFEQLVLQGDGPIAVEFMAYSCGHCAVLEPALQQAAARLGAEERIFRVNTVTDQDLAHGFEIEGTPTIVLFLDGNEVGRAEGPSPDLSKLMAELTQPFKG